MPPDPAPRPDAKKTREINWTKVGSLAAVAAALIAFLAYALPSGGSTPDPVTTRPGPAVSASSAFPAESTSAPATTSPPSPPPSPAPSLIQVSGPPAGCQKADAAITTYNQTIGSTWYSRQDAAGQAANGIFAAFGSGASGKVASDLSALDNDFTNMRNVAMAQASNAWDTLATEADKDIQVLNTDCSNG
jgi:hypothetical protein